MADGLRFHVLPGLVDLDEWTFWGQFHPHVFHSGIENSSSCLGRWEETGLQASPADDVFLSTFANDFWITLFKRQFCAFPCENTSFLNFFMFIVPLWLVVLQTLNQTYRRTGIGFQSRSRIPEVMLKLGVVLVHERTAVAGVLGQDVCLTSH